MKTGFSVILLSFVFTLQLLGQVTKTFTINYSNTLSRIKSFANVNDGPSDALAGYKDARIKFIRAHDYYGPFDFPYYTDFFAGDSINPDFDPTDPNHYFWHMSDSTIAVNHDNGFETFFRLGISYDLNSKSPYWDPPYDYGATTYNNISEVFRRTVMHFNDGWDSGFHYGIKYWEIWNEPDGTFWNSHVPRLTFFRFYEAVSNAVKSYDPDLLVGGPGFLSLTVTEPAMTYIPDFINYCKENGCPLDFLSWHLYMEFNPYAVYYFADRIRNMLDEAGFTNAESIITETNMDYAGNGNPLLNSPKSAAWFASMMICAQNSSLDMLYVYRGDHFMNMIGDDIDGQPSFTWSGLGFKSFSVLADEAPIQVDASGSEFIDAPDAMATDTTNVMVLASRTESEDACYALVSNYNSAYTDFNIDVNNLPWPERDSIVVTQYVTNPVKKFIKTESVIKSAPGITLNLHGLPAPSVVLLKMVHKVTPVAVENEPRVKYDFHISQNYPNPFNPSTIISYSLPEAGRVDVSVYNAIGQKIKTLVASEKQAGLNTVSWNAADQPSGIYFVRIYAEAGKSGDVFNGVRKMLLLK